MLVLSELKMERSFLCSENIFLQQGCQIYTARKLDLFYLALGNMALSSRKTLPCIIYCQLRNHLWDRAGFRPKTRAADPCPSQSWSCWCCPRPELKLELPLRAPGWIHSVPRASFGLRELSGLDLAWDMK